MMRMSSLSVSANRSARSLMSRSSTVAPTIRALVSDWFPFFTKSS